MILTVLLLVPLAGAAIARLLPRFARAVALWSMLVLAGAAAWSVLRFDTAADALQMVQHAQLAAFGSFDLAYHVGVDGISYPLVLLTAVLGLVAVLVSRREVHTDEGTHYLLLLGVVAAAIGVFISLDLVLFFVFWEAVLVLMFLLILLWGGENRSYAAMKFLVYTGIGSGALLLAIILIGATAGTMDMTLLGTVPGSVRAAALCLLLLAFLIKMPIVPFHTWLPDAHVQAPTAGSVLLAGVLLKMGAYGLLRLGVPLGLLNLRMLLFALGSVTILYGAWVCLGQRNLKRLIAYSSVSHMGFVLLGIAAGSALGITGAVFGMVSHGIIAALLFALAGLVHERTGTFDLDALHGLAVQMPKVGWLLVIASLGAMGLPSMSGFVAEFLVLLAASEAFGLLALIPVAGIIFTGGYIVRLLSCAVFGTGRVHASERGAGMTPFVLLLALAFIVGIFPFLLITFIAASPLT